MASEGKGADRCLGAAKSLSFKANQLSRVYVSLGALDVQPRMCILSFHISACPFSQW